MGGGGGGWGWEEYEWLVYCIIPPNGKRRCLGTWCVMQECVSVSYIGCLTIIPSPVLHLEFSLGGGGGGGGGIDS